MMEQIGVDIVIGVPDWIKQLIGTDFPELTQKVVVTYTNQRPAEVKFECIGMAPDEPVLLHARYVRVKHKICYCWFCFNTGPNGECEKCGGIREVKCEAGSKTTGGG